MSVVTEPRPYGISTLHKTGTGIGTKWKVYSVVPCGNVHTGLRQGRDQDPLFPIVSVPFHVLVPVLFPCSVNKPLLCCTNKKSSTENGYVCGDMKVEQSTVVSFVNAHRKLLDISFNCNRYLATSATEYVCVFFNHHLGIATLEF